MKNRMKITVKTTTETMTILLMREKTPIFQTETTPKIHQVETARKKITIPLRETARKKIIIPLRIIVGKNATILQTVEKAERERN